MSSPATPAPLDRPASPESTISPDPTVAPKLSDEARVTAGLLIGVAEVTKRTFESAASRFELSPPQARALLLLGDALPMHAIADHLRCDASNVTGIADRLVSRGLVARQPDPADRRVKRLVPTEQGRRVRAELDRAVSAASPLIASLDPAERAALRGLLEKIVANATVEPCPPHR